VVELVYTWGAIVTFIVLALIISEITDPRRRR
jgi:hypothetical protein